MHLCRSAPAFPRSVGTGVLDLARDGLLLIRGTGLLVDCERIRLTSMLCALHARPSLIQTRNLLEYLRVRTFAS